VQTDLLALEEIASVPSSENSLGFDAYPGIHVKAAVLLAELLRCRPFDRANRAVALLSAIVFLNLNGYEVTASEDELTELVTLAADKRLSMLMVAAAFESATERFRLADLDG
jgi:death on curing protein